MDELNIDDPHMPQRLFATGGGNFRAAGWEHCEHSDPIALRRRHPVECRCVDAPDTSVVLKMMLERRICAAPPNNGEGLSPRQPPAANERFG
jgi:hypothetical protein